MDKIWQDEFCERMDKQILEGEVNEHYKNLWERYSAEILEYCEDAVSISVVQKNARIKELEDYILNHTACACGNFDDEALCLKCKLKFRGSL